MRVSYGHRVSGISVKILPKLKHQKMIHVLFLLNDSGTPWAVKSLQISEAQEQRLYHKQSSVIRLRDTHPNHIWSIDFVHDKLSNGRSYKILAVLD